MTLAPPSSWRLKPVAHMLALGAIAAVGNTALAQADSVATPEGGVSSSLLIFEPSVSLTQTFSSNGGLKSVNVQAEQTTQATVGIHAASNRGLLRGFFDYSLSAQAYAQGGSDNSRQQSLNASGTLTAIENRAFVDLSGVISQQAVSAFGTQSIDGGVANGNLSETATFRISPYVQGELGSGLAYQARYSLASTRSAQAASSNSLSKDLALGLTGGAGGSRISWSLDATRQRVEFTEGRSTDSDRLRASVTAAINPQLSLTAIGSTESSNLNSATKESRSLGGWGANWAPSELTRLSWQRENRPFGSSHSLSFEHRTGRTVWRLTDSRDLSTGSGQSATPSLGSVYDLYFAQFAALEPDPVKRAQRVNEFLQANGLSPTAVAEPTGYLTSSLSVQRNQSLSVALLGVRDTITLLASRSEGSRVDTLAGSNDDFSSSPVVRQVGLSVNYSHRLTPQTSLSMSLSGQQSSGASSAQDTSLYALLANVSTQVGLRTSANLGLRRVVFQSNDAPYDETAITCSISMRF